MAPSAAEHTGAPTGAAARTRLRLQPERARLTSSTPAPFSSAWDPIVNTPNVVTLVRTVLSVAIAGVAISETESWLLVVAYAVYWLGDILDGWLARRLGQETRLGAVFDIISDRACTSILCVGVMVSYPGFAIVIVLFFVSFMVLDTVLSLAFLCWPVLSPNYFGRVDQAVYRLNWSPLAKSLNTGGVMTLLLVGPVWAALGLVIVLLGVKIWSIARVQSLLRTSTRAAT